MTQSNESQAQLRQRVAVLEDRISGLCASVLRVSASLDLDTVLQEVVDNARALTGARYGVIATEGDTGMIQDFVTSGFTPEEREEMAAWSEGPRLFAHFRDLQAPLRLANLPEYVRKLGFSTSLMRSQTLQCTPMRHRNVYVGSFFLAEKEGAPEFTDGDEEVLVLFASQAAAAIANARARTGTRGGPGRIWRPWWKRRR
ncbi:MAG: GAF domain-containing protein [Acidobacteria bacterium]|nr:GAF domain-containing protein [Acidobacteriota bacterium]